MNAEQSAESWSDGAVTPDDATTFASPRPRGFCVVSTGNVVIQDQAGNELTFAGVAAGPTIYRYRVHRVMAATTAGVALVY